MKKKQRIRNKWLTGSLLFLTLSASFPAQAARSPEVTETELLRSGEGDEAELEGPGPVSYTHLTLPTKLEV